MPALQEKSPKDIGRALVRALKEGNMEAGRYFLTAPEVDVRVFLDANLHTALHYAATRNYVDIVQNLLERGANCNTQGKDGYTPLHVAVKAGNTECVKLLLNKGAAANIKTARFFHTALHLACLVNNADITKLLLQNGADIYAQDKDGCAPLHYAVKSGSLELVQALLEKMASLASGSSSSNTGINARVKGDYTPLYFAVVQGNKDVIELLLEKGADPNISDDNNYTALHLAVKKNLIEITRLLLLKGAEVNSITKDGKRPQDLTRHPEILADLQCFGANIPGFTPPEGYAPPNVSFSERQTQIKNFTPFEKYFEE